MQQVVVRNVFVIAFIFSVLFSQPAIASFYSPEDTAKKVLISEPEGAFASSLESGNSGELEESELDETAIEDLFAPPGRAHYMHWDTETVHPYKFDLTQFKDTVIINLLDSFACDFAMPVKGRITSGFGYRKYRYHKGIDIDLHTGDSVFAAFDGVVRIAQYSSSYGYVVVLRHFNGLETFYAHLSKLEVEPGQAICAGEPVGLGGNTGRSRGSHLHFEVRYKGWPIDPARVISFETNELTASSIQVHAGTFKDFTGTGTTAEKYYTVRRGDNLSVIARKHRTSVSQLCRLNKISSRTTIYPGQKLRVR